MSFNPGAIENSNTIVNKLVPNNVRLTNNSVGNEYKKAERTINYFLRKWSISGASIAIAKDGKLIYARGFGYADTAFKAETQPYSQVQNCKYFKTCYCNCHYEVN